MPDTHPAMTTPVSEAPAFTAITEPQQSKSQASMWVCLMNLQRELDPIKKDQKNEHLHTTYADLNAVWNAIRQPLQDQGLLVIQEPIPYPRGAMVTTTLVHIESGEWRSSTIYMPARKADAQAFGSALSYARRYSLLTVLSLMTTDDDGHQATLPPPRPEVQRTAPPTAAATDEATAKGWQNWSQKMMLQIQGCESEQALVQLWTGMQPELKQAPDEVRFGLTALKDSEKEKWSRQVGIDVGPDKGAAGDDVPF